MLLLLKRYQQIKITNINIYYTHQKRLFDKPIDLETHQHLSSHSLVYVFPSCPHTGSCLSEHTHVCVPWPHSPSLSLEMLLKNQINCKTSIQHFRHTTMQSLRDGLNNLSPIVNCTKYQLSLRKKKIQLYLLFAKGCFVVVVVCLLLLFACCCYGCCSCSFFFWF